MRRLVLFLLVASAAADPLPEGGELKLTAPDAGQLLRDDRRRVEVRWESKGLPAGALVRVQYRVGEGRWWTATGGSFVPAARGEFMCAIARTRAKGTVAIGLTYFAPHEPKIWTVTKSDGLKAIQDRVRPGDTVQFTVAEAGTSVTLPSGVTVRGAPGSGTSIVFGKRSGVGLIIAGVPGLELPARLEDLRFRMGREPPPRMADYPRGVSILGGRAELVNCVFDKGLGVGIRATDAAQVQATGCRFSVVGGDGAHALGAGTTLVVEGGVVTNCRQGVVGHGDTTVICRDVSFQDNQYCAVRINGRFARRVLLEKCRFRGNRDGASLRVLGTAIVRECTFDMGRFAIEVEGLSAMRTRSGIEMRTRAQVLIEKNTIRGASIGVRAIDVADCVVRSNKFNQIDYVGVKLDCPGTVENNRFYGTKRPPDYAPPAFEPAWRFGTMGVLFGIDRGDAKPTILNNDLRGCTKYPIVLVGGAEATIAENKFDKEVAKPIFRPGRGNQKQRAESKKLWGQARAKWEHKHPEERKRRWE